MAKAWNIIKETIVDLADTVTYFFTSNMRNFANVLNFSCPYLMYFLGQSLQAGVGEMIFCLLIPVIISLFTYIFHSAANKIGKGNACPVPAKRFTEVTEDGEVSIANDRIQELLLYMADLEDWMERKNIL